MIARLLVAAGLLVAVFAGWQCGSENQRGRPASTEGVLVYTRGASVWVADGDGSNARRLVAGSLPRVSPDGRTVVFGRVVVPARTFRTAVDELRAVAATGGRSRRLLGRWLRELAWSPDSRYLAAVTGRGGRGASRGRLVLINVGTGAVRTIATGYFSEMSFSPTGEQLVYGRSRSQRGNPAKSYLYVVETRGGAPRRLTHDGRSSSPLWGPDRIVYVHATPPPRRRDPPKNRVAVPRYNLWLIDADGRGRHELTRVRTPFHILPSAWSSLTPTAWSADGKRLLAAHHGETSQSARTVDPRTGRLGADRTGLVGFALSKDGSTILAVDDFTGPDPGPRSDVVAVPFEGGRPRMLARRASDPHWNR